MEEATMMADTVIQIISLGVAVASAVISVLFSLRTNRDTKIQTQMQTIALLREYYSELQRWSDAVVEAITEAIFLCDYDPAKMQDGELFTKWITTKQKISALLDQGRFFLPNEEADKVGQHKPVAYRGYRPPALNCLAAVYELLNHFNCTAQAPNRNLRPKLWDARRDFVSQLQKTLNPQERESQLQNMAKNIRR
jgi:hypothetical protein